MKLTELFLAELDREGPRSRRALEQYPDGRGEWKPHEKSMMFGYLAQLVATMPSWVTMHVKQNELDLNPPGGSPYTVDQPKTAQDLVAALDKTLADARAALEGTTDEHLMTPWRLLVAGNVVAEEARHVMIRETLNHWAHHRGQMTVYLRLLGQKVPALYGPSADERRF